jgi:hypothetical protein
MIRGYTMNKRIFKLAALICLCTLFAFSLACKKADDKTGVKDAASTDRIKKALVTADVLKVREEPSTQGKELARLERGTIVEIIEKGTTSIKVGDIEDVWDKIKSGDITGWCFAGFLAHWYYSSPDGKTVAWSSSKPVNDIVKMNIFMTDTKKILVIEHEIQSTWSDFSPGFKYFGVETGTDIVRRIVFYDVNTGKSIAGDSYIGEKPKWEGDSVKYKKVTYVGGCVLWTKSEFKDGKIVQGSETGKEHYHDMELYKKDPKCK